MAIWLSLGRGKEKLSSSHGVYHCIRAFGACNVPLYVARRWIRIRSSVKLNCVLAYDDGTLIKRIFATVLVSANGYPIALIPRKIIIIWLIWIGRESKFVRAYPKHPPHSPIVSNQSNMHKVYIFWNAVYTARGWILHSKIEHNKLREYTDRTHSQCLMNIHVKITQAFI